MPLDGDQQEILLNTLYSVAASGRAVDAVAPHIEVIGGKVNIYGSDQQPGAAPTGMYQTTDSTAGFSGIDRFGVVPNYLYITQFSGSTTKITLTGIQAKVV